MTLLCVLAMELLKPVPSMEDPEMVWLYLYSAGDENKMVIRASFVFVWWWAQIMVSHMVMMMYEKYGDGELICLMFEIFIC